MKYKQIKEIMKISIVEISDETASGGGSRISTTMVHRYISIGDGLSAERVKKIESAIEAVARKRIEDVRILLGDIDE